MFVPPVHGPLILKHETWFSWFIPLLYFHALFLDAFSGLWYLFMKNGMEIYAEKRYPEPFPFLCHQYCEWWGCVLLEGLANPWVQNQLHGFYWLSFSVNIWFPVGWSSGTRKLDIRYCYNWSRAVYAIRAPFWESKANEFQSKGNENEDSTVFNLVQSISSAFFPSFSQDGKFLVFSSVKEVLWILEHIPQLFHFTQLLGLSMGTLPAYIVDVIPCCDGC